MRVVRTPKRRSTVSARIVDGVLELRVPQRMPRGEEAYWIDRLGRRLVAREGGPDGRGDAELERRAQDLNRRYYDGRFRWRSIAFTSQQQRRWGSCSTLDGAIRISEKARRLPAWVLDYLLAHELAHLVHDNHGPEFWELVAVYPLMERARGYLMAIDDGEAGAGQQVLPLW